ncbi:MAG: dihydropteroate synthase [Lachnospiraceae bacterium]|nr:dihydropteroate synthase [Lachnospiraceae bacterium]
MKTGEKLSHGSGDTLVAGILNLTPDSFSDGGLYEKEGILKRVECMIEEGADMIDIGAESTRPGARTVTAREEMERLIPALKEIRKHTDIYISVDTYKPEVARAALEEGADMLNDVSGLGYGGAGMAELSAEYNVPVILMYNRAYHNGPDDPKELVGYINSVLFDAARNALEKGVSEDNIIIDPGVGFAGGTENDLTILRNLEDICSWGWPVMLGCSRKSVIGNTLNLPVDRREEATIVTSILGAQAGCAIVRVHNVMANRRALDMLSVIRHDVS